MLKDWKKVYRNLKSMRGVSEEEKVLLAQALAATPDISDRSAYTVIGRGKN